MVVKPVTFPPRPGQTGRDAEFYRIAAGNHDDRYSRRGLMGSRYRGRSVSKDHSNFFGGQPSSGGRKTVVSVHQGTIVDTNISSFHVPQCAQAIAECVNERRTGAGVDPQQANPRHLPRLLRECKRCGERTPD